MHYLIQCLEEAVDVCAQQPDHETDSAPDELIYSKIVNVYGKDIKIRTVLEANRFEGTVYILLRRFFYSREKNENEVDNTEPIEPTDEDFRPCRGSFRFSKEDLDNLKMFVARMLSTSHKHLSK